MESFSEEFLGIPKVIWKGILFLIVCVAIYYGWKRNKDNVWYVINEYIWCYCVGSSRLVILLHPDKFRYSFKQIKQSISRYWWILVFVTLGYLTMEEWSNLFMA